MWVLFQKHSKKIRIIECNICKIFFHIRCSDINKKEILHLKGNGDNWICKSCRPPIQVQDEIKCFDCRKTIAKNRTIIQCSECTKVYHAICAGISVKNYIGSNSWTCKKCMCSSMPFYGIDNEKLRLTLMAKDVPFRDHIHIVTLAFHFKPFWTHF